MKKAHLLSGLALLSTGVHLLNRRVKRSGATSAEATQRLPGDETITQPAYDATHAITIAAAPERIWPWLLQMGYYRGGWYTENDFWWDRLTTRYLRFLVRGEARQSGYGHREQPSVTAINPEWQQLAVDDQILDGPPGMS